VSEERSMPTNIEVRELRSAEEARALGALNVEAYTGLAGLTPGSPYLDELADVERRAASTVVLVAVDAAGQLAGGVTYVPGPGPYAEFDDPDGAGMRMLAVAPSQRARGVGTSLVRACIERARAAGRRRLWLHTTADMVAAQRIYARLGFRRAPEADRHHPDVDLLAYVLDLAVPG
jgi:ribosomal protein S18 acetylase RimI-like enzyme